jgi:hypothetical protein
MPQGARHVVIGTLGLRAASSSGRGLIRRPEQGANHDEEVPTAHTARVKRRACVRSAMRPATGAETKRIAVPAPNKMPISSGGIPRSSMKAGKKG